MDRRQQKTRTAILQAFAELLSEKRFAHITVQQIIDRANVGRTTFYTHFETKDHLLKSLCEELFGHILPTADQSQPYSLYHCYTVSESMFCHLLRHLQEDKTLLRLLSGESSELFSRYFKDSLNTLICTQLLTDLTHLDLPQDFLINHISGSFVEMVQWWIQNHCKQSPEELDRYFRIVIEPLL